MIPRFIRSLTVALVLAACGARTRPIDPPRELAPPLARGPRDVLGRRLERLVSAVVARGGRLAGPPRRTFLGERGHAVLTVDLEAGCHVLAALGVSAVGDLDMGLHDIGGMLIREDVERDALPSVRFCPPTQTTVTVVLLGRDGGGEVALADLAVGSELALDIADALGERADAAGTPSLAAPSPARRAPPLPGPADSAITAEQAVALAAHDLLEIGYVPAREDLSGGLEHGRVATHRLDLDAGACYAIVAAGDGGVRDLDLRLLDDRDAELARDTATDPRPRLRACAERSGPYRLEVRMFDGNGRYAVRTLSSTTLADAPDSLPALLRQRWAEISARLRARGFAPTLPLERGDLRWTGRQVHRVSVRRGTCYAIAAASADGDLDLSLVTTDGAVIASDTGDDPTPVVMTCPRQSETLDVEVKLYRARTQYVLGVWASPPEDV